MNQNEISLLINEIKKLTVQEKSHILTILKRNNVHYTKNVNGFFFNLSNIERDIFDKIRNCINLIVKNRDLIKTLEKKRVENIEYYKTFIENKLKERLQNEKKNFYEKILLDDSCIMNFKIEKVVKNRKVHPVYDTNHNCNIKKMVIGKKSVYFNIYKILKKRKKYKIVVEEKEDNMYHGEDTNDYSYDDDDIDIGQDDYIGDLDDMVDIDWDIGEDLDIDLGTSRELEHDPSERELYQDPDQEAEATECTEITDEIFMKIQSFKRILETHGYIFDNDKFVKMVCEEYIF